MSVVQRHALAVPVLATTVVLAQVGLAAGLGFVPVGTRAQGTGAALSTALFLLAGYALGRLDRRPAEEGPEGSWRPAPWGRVLLLSVLLSALGLVGWVGGGLDGLFPRETIGPGGLARAMLATDAVLFAACAHVGLGASLGANTQPRTTAFGVGGAALLFGLVFGLRELARALFVDPAVVGGITALAVGVAALTVGFVLSWARRRLAFVEMAIVALVFGYALYLAVAIGPPSLVISWSIPIEQTLLALSIVPTVALMALLAVGGSLGYLLFGSGRLDTGFGFEVLVAKRYLQVNLRGTRSLLAMGLSTVTVLGLAAAAGAVGRARAESWAGALAYALPVVVGALAIRAMARRRPARGALLIGVLALAAGAGGLVGRHEGAAVGAALATLVGLVLRVPHPDPHRRRAPFVGVVTVISIVGVALGVMALIVVLSVMSGFEGDLKSKILGAHAHVVVEKLGDDFLEHADVEAKVREAPGVQTAASFVLGDAMISTDAGLSGALVKGVDPASEDAVGELRRNLERGQVELLLRPADIPGACGKRYLPSRPQPPPLGATSTTPAPPLPLDAVALAGAADCRSRVLPGIIVGKELSRALRAYVGDVVKLVSPVSDEIGPLGPTPKLRRFRVAGIFYSGMYEYDAKLAYVSMEQAQRFFGMRGEATGVELKIADIDASGAVVSDLDRRLGGRPYRVKDWREMNKELFSALLLEKIAMFVALTMIITVASFLIVATLVMIVLQRGREIAILKSIGASSASIMKIFVVQGVIVGVGGALLGVAAGVGTCVFLEEVGLRLDERIFYIEKLPVILDWGQVGVIAGSAVTIAYLATIYPAMTAADLRPVDGLRDD